MYSSLVHVAIEDRETKALKSLSEKKLVLLSRARSFSLLLLAWSLPVSLFGMQLSIALCALVIMIELVSGNFSVISPSGLDRPIVFWLAIVALSLLLAPKHPTSFMTATSFWVVLAYFGVFFLLPNPSILRKAILGMIFLACLAALFGAFQSVTGQFPFVEYIHSSTPEVLKSAPGMHGWFGAVGLFQSRLTFAHVLLFPLCWSMALMMEKLTLKWRVLFGLAVCLLSLGIVFTWTRAAPVAAALACSAIVIGAFHKGWHRRFALVAFMCLVALSALIVPQETKRLESSFSGKRDWGRLAIWHSALDLGASSPMTGIGYGNFQRDVVPLIEKRTRQVGAKTFKATIAWAHNNLLTFFAEAGALGVLAFCWIFFAYFSQALRVLRRSQQQPWLRGFLRGSMASVAAFLLLGMVHDTFFDGEVIITLWVTMGASLAVGRFLPSEEPEEKRQKEKSAA